MRLKPASTHSGSSPSQGSRLAWCVLIVILFLGCESTSRCRNVDYQYTPQDAPETSGVAYAEDCNNCEDIPQGVTHASGDAYAEDWDNREDIPEQAMPAPGCVYSEDCDGCQHIPQGAMHAPGCVCAEDCDDCEDIPQGAIPAPVGVYLDEFNARQAAKAEVDDFVICLNEWLKGGLELGPYGRDHLGMIIERLPTVPFPVMIQASGDPAKDQARLELVVGQLLNAGFSDAENIVIVGHPYPGGLYGEEAEPIYRGLLLGGRGLGGYGQGSYLSGFGGPSRFQNAGSFGGFGRGFGGSLGGY